jgi:hypothetical protein
MARQALLALLATGLAACEAQPTVLCDRARMVWPFFEIDPSDDIDPVAEGIQIDLEISSTIWAGTEARLSVTPAGGDPVLHPDQVVVEDDGRLVFRAITLPTGRLTLTVLLDGECGSASSGRNLFVWDGLGMPECELSMAEAAEVPALAPHRVLRAEHDEDPEGPGMQISVSVVTGRPDMIATLFVLDLSTGLERQLEQESGEDRTAEYDLTLDDGLQALRAVCHWPPADLRPSSITRQLLVDSEPPDCELVEPTARVLAVDDLDTDEPGLQFEMRGRSSAPDAIGQPAEFEADGTRYSSSAVDQTGEASTIATVFTEVPPAPQVLRFRAWDQAGNSCEVTETY